MQIPIGSAKTLLAVGSGLAGACLLIVTSPAAHAGPIVCTTFTVEQPSSIRLSGWPVRASFSAAIVSSVSRADDSVFWIGHRGAHTFMPENTLAAFRAAVEGGLRILEFDVSTTRDGHLVLMHDNWDVDRTTDGVGPVNSFTLAEIKTLDAGSYKGMRFAGERVPTLEEALAFCRENAVIPIIDVKDAPLATLRADIDASGIPRERVWWLVGSTGMRDDVHAAVPECPLIRWAGSATPFQQSEAVMQADLTSNVIAVSFPYYGLDVRWSAEEVAHIRSHGLGFSIGHVVPETIPPYLERGVNFYIVNAPSIAPDHLRRFKSGVVTATSPSGASVQISFDSLARISGDARLGQYRSSLTLPPNAEPGSWRLSLQLTDAKGVAFAAESLELPDIIVPPIASSVSAPSYRTWAQAAFSAESADQDPGSDPDRDGVPNLTEFAWGGDPLVSDAKFESPAVIEGAAGPTLRFRLPQGALRSPDGRYLWNDVLFHAEMSDDLVHWTHVTGEGVISSEDPSGDQIDLPLEPNCPRMFARVFAQIVE